MRITLEQFTCGMGLLSAVYGSDHPAFNNPDIAEIWFNFFASKYSNDKFLQMIKHYLGVCHWFPRVPNDICKVWEESGCDRPPGEDYRAVQEQSLLSLPSTEAQAKIKELEEIKNMSPEQMLENRRRWLIMYKIASDMKNFKTEDKQSKLEYLAKAPLHELEAIAKTCEKAKQLAVVGDKYGNLEVSPNALFEDMKKYFHSGSEKYHQIAINWASDPANGCEIVKLNGKVVDIRQVDF
jgi:hypothetical protein